MAYDQEEAKRMNPYTDDQTADRQHDKMNPTWRAVIWDGVDTGYSISCMGDLCDPSGKMVRPLIGKSGYVHFTIVVDGTRHITTGHRLVADAFIENPENKPQVNHINSVRSDNWYRNLEWVTPSENMKHSVEHGFFKSGCVLAKVGEEHPGARHTEEQAKQVCELLSQGLRTGEIIKQTGLDRNFVYGILKMGKWSHVAKNYTIIDRTGEPLYTDDQVHECCRYLSSGKSNRWIADKMSVPVFFPYTVRNGSYRPDISSQYTFPSVPQRDGSRKISNDTAHKICRLLELGVGVTEITKIIPSVSKMTIHQIKSKKQYVDISNQYSMPEPTKVKGVRSGRVKAGTSKSGIVARLGVGYAYEQVIAALTRSTKSTNGI